MSQKILITADDVTVSAELDDSETARAIAAALPIQVNGQRWGDEIYAEIPVERGLSDDAREIMNVGELAYWPPGRAFCVFFGPTPASDGAEPRAASPVNPVGRVLDDVSPLKSVPSGRALRIEQAPGGDGT